MNGYHERVIGESRRGVPITALVPRRRDADVLIVAAVHGEEPETLFLARRLADRIGGADGRALIIACANPDGVLAGTR